jgi:predicted transcriptional regulator
MSQLVPLPLPVPETVTDEDLSSSPIADPAPTRKIIPPKKGVNMSVAAIYQSLPSVISDFVETKEPQMRIARPFVASMAETFSALGKEIAAKSDSLGKRKCDLLSEQERNQVHEIVDQLLKTKDVNGHPLLRIAMWVEKDRENVLKILRFLAENGFSEEVTNILLSERNGYAIGSALSITMHKKELHEIIDMLPKGTQEYLKNVTYIEYGGFNDANVYETFIIGGGTYRAS